MKTKSAIIVVIALFVNSVQNLNAEDIREFFENKESDGLKFLRLLKQENTIESFAISPTKLVVKTGDRAVIWLQAGPHTEVSLTLDKETVFSEDHSWTTFTPVFFKNNLKGFRISFEGHSMHSGMTIHTMYLALSEPPVQVGEEDVERVMDKGVWVTAEEARRRLEKQLERNLILQKFGRWEAQLILLFEDIMRNPKMMAEIAENPELTEAWNNLVKEGIIKTNVVKKAGTPSFSLQKKWLEGQDGPVGDDGQNEEQHKTNSLWLYVGIPLCALLPVLYLLRRKLKTKT